MEVKKKKRVWCVPYCRKYFFRIDGPQWGIQIEILHLNFFDFFTPLYSRGKKIRRREGGWQWNKSDPVVPCRRVNFDKVLGIVSSLSLLLFTSVDTEILTPILGCFLPLCIFFNGLRMAHLHYQSRVLEIHIRWFKVQRFYFPNDVVLGQNLEFDWIGSQSSERGSPRVF